MEYSDNPYTRVKQDLADHPDWLPVITEGDSWFAFPSLLLRMNVISHLQYTFKARMALLRMAYHGDNLKDMLCGKQLAKLKRALSHPIGFKLMLFSGGGNDLIQSFPGFVRKRGDCDHWRDCITEELLTEKLEEIEFFYLKLIRLRDELNPECKIFTHSYDYSSVNGNPVKIGSIVLSGAWLKPVFIKHGITSTRTQRNMVKYVMDKFYDVLKRVEQDNKARFTVVDTRGTLRSRDWGDEIHPTHEGFELITEKIAKRLKKDFPNQFAKRGW